MDGPAGAGQQSSVVSGAGLTWSLVKRSNTQSGAAEIWAARATSALNRAAVRATPTAGGYWGSLTVIAFAGASGTNVAGAAGAPSGAPSIYLPGVATGSWVFAVGNDWDGATSRVPAAGQVVEQEYLAPVGDTFWVQRTATPSVAARPGHHRRHRPVRPPVELCRRRGHRGARVVTAARRWHRGRRRGHQPHLGGLQGRRAFLRWGLRHHPAHAIRCGVPLPLDDGPGVPERGRPWPESSRPVCKPWPSSGPQPRAWPAGLWAALIAFTPSFTFILFGADHFDSLRTNTTARAVLDGSGPAAIGAILGSAWLLASALTQPWQYAVLLGAAVFLLALRRDVVSVLLSAAAIGILVATAGGQFTNPPPASDRRTEPNATVHPLIGMSVK